MSKFIDLTGQIFSLYKVIGRDTLYKGSRAKWICKCECGIEKSVHGYCLKNGSTKSCGCLSRKNTGDRSRIHGQSGTSEYNIWSTMVSRCTKTNDKKFDDYGGRGISVDQRWMDDFQAFYDDMGSRPSLKHSIDRIDVNGNYEPNNCRWATPDVQSRNQRVRKASKSGVKGVYWHEKKKKWCAQLSLNYKIIHLGSFDSIDDATEARKQGEIKYWGKSS